MDTLSIHLLYLSGRHDCVIVPGFGAFITEEIPARIDSETLTVLPAERRVGFNSELTDDDGLLVHSIARRNRISHPDARRIIDHAVSALRERFEEGFPVEFAGIGSLRLSGEGRKIFTPELKSDREVCVLPLSEGEATPESPEQPLQTPRQDISDDNFSTEPVVEPGEYVLCESERPSGGNLPMNVFISRVACALVIVVGALMAFILPGIQNPHPVQRASVVPVETLLNIKPAKETPKAEIEVAKPTATTEVASEEAIRSEALPFHLIVGTFSTREEAERFIALAEDDSTSLTPVSSRSGIWRVAAASASEASELQSELNRLNSRFPGVWIWEKP